MHRYSLLVSFCIFHTPMVQRNISTVAGLALKAWKNRQSVSGLTNITHVSLLPQGGILAQYCQAALVFIARTAERSMWFAVLAE
ncbi:hypothetical protein [Klebsiella aerogenes]|uniref:hypothetical protein n=1 Tax=Klebsiella aerogenes TaxID=548 RepID=UPI00178C245F|nr:hypothetical protein [Klebsiella aerogenes]